jgi:colanic acid biosynthesis glycosyl transferase WcaI
MNQKKNITIITPNYYPEDTAIGLYTTEFANKLVLNGYTVQIITGFPYYPQWKIKDTYADKPKYFQETHNNITIYRYRMYLPKKITFFGRIKMMLSFLKGTINNVKKIKESDLVFCIVPFTLFIYPSFLLSKKKKAILWIHIQDLEFDLAFESGIFNNYFSRILKFFIFKLEKILLNKANIISTISFNMLKKVKSKTEKKEIFYFPNWVSPDMINPETAKKHPIFNENKFSILYSGNIGQKQNWEIFTKLCEKIKETDNIEIIIVGDGAYLNELKNKIASFKFVKTYPPVPFSELNNLLCSADLHFLFQKTEVIDTVMPSKVLGMLASEKPSIITGNNESEVKSIFEKANCGYFLNSNNCDSIYNLIFKLKDDFDLRTTYGKNGRKYIIKHYSETTILNKTISKINHLLNN